MSAFPQEDNQLSVTSRVNPSPLHIANIIKTFLLLGLGLYFTLNIITGNLTNYINVRFAWLSYVAAILFTVLGLVTLYAVMRKDTNSHRNISLPTILIMAIPLVLGTLLPSQPLGASAINGTIALNVGGGELSSVTQDPLQRNILDWARIFANSELPAEFDGQQADVIGFYYVEPTFPENHFMVARFTVSCCVADAAPLGLPVMWSSNDEIQQGQWVRVTGAFKAGDFRDERTPILQATSIEPIEQPDHPYLYP